MSVCVCQPCGEDILASLRQLEDLLREGGERPDASAQNNPAHQECLYYLNTYGTHLALVSFYMRHDCTSDALTHLLDKVRPASLAPPTLQPITRF